MCVFRTKPSATPQQQWELGLLSHMHAAMCYYVDQNSVNAKLLFTESLRAVGTMDVGRPFTTVGTEAVRLQQKLHELYIMLWSNKPETLHRNKTKQKLLYFFNGSVELGRTTYTYHDIL
jgi:hypothetical protein